MNLLELNLLLDKHKELFEEHLGLYKYSKVDLKAYSNVKQIFCNHVLFLFH